MKNTIYIRYLMLCNICYVSCKLCYYVKCKLCCNNINVIYTTLYFIVKYNVNEHD